MASVTKVTAGKWRVRYRDGVGRSAPSRSKTFATERDAKAFMRERDAMSAIGVGNTSKVTLGAFVTQWIEGLRSGADADAGSRQIQPTSVTTYVRNIGKFVDAVGPGVGIDKVTEAHCEDSLNKAARDYSVDTVKGVRTAARAMFKRAVKQRLIKSVPMSNARDWATAKERHTPRKRATAPTVEQLVAMINTARLPEWKRLLGFFASTGLRRGELAGLKWQDVDFRAGTLTVTRTVIEYTAPEGHRVHEVREGHAKTQGSLRTFPLAKEELAVLRLQREQVIASAEALGATFDEDCYCWPRSGEVRHHMGLTQLTGTARSIRKRAGLPDDIRPIHGLRHRAARSMLSGAPIEAIAGRLGHSDPRTTSMIYVEPEQQHLEQAASAAVAGLGDALAATSAPSIVEQERNIRPLKRSA